MVFLSMVLHVFDSSEKDRMKSLRRRLGMDSDNGLQNIQHVGK